MIKGKSILVDKSYAFSLRLVKLNKHLIKVEKEYVLSKQVLRSGTSICANATEAQAAFSKKDFTHKMSIASKEARETLYWLNILKDSEYLPNEFENLIAECEELVKMLTSIVKSSMASSG